MRLGIADKIFIEFELDSIVAVSDPLPLDASSDVMMGSGSPSRLDDFPTTRSSGLSSEVPSSSDGSLLQAVGIDVEEPWNMGRRVGPNDSTIKSASQAAAVVVPSNSSLISRSTDQPRGSRGGRMRLPRQRKTICTYAFLWPVHNPALLGTEGLSESMASLPSGLSYDPPSGSPLSGLPSWLYGLHSIRYNPGPDWIEASEQDCYQVTRNIMILLYKSVPCLSLMH